MQKLDDEWRVATNGVSDRKGPKQKESLTLKTLFWVVGDGVTTVERY